MSYRPEVQTAGDPGWYANALRFATPDEAQAYTLDLMMRWTRVEDTRVVPSEDPISHVWVEGYAHSLARINP